MPRSILSPATRFDPSSQISARSASKRSNARLGSSFPSSYHAATKRFHSRSTLSRSLSSTSLPWMVANRSCPLDTKVAIARPSLDRFSAMPLSLVLKNQIGPRSPSSCAVSGRACPSSTPASPTIMVMSDLTAFQNLSSSSCGVGIVHTLRLRLHSNGRKHRKFRGTGNWTAGAIVCARSTLIRERPRPFGRGLRRNGRVDAQASVGSVADLERLEVVVAVAVMDLALLEEADGLIRVGRLVVAVGLLVAVAITMAVAVAAGLGGGGDGAEGGGGKSESEDGVAHRRVPWRVQRSRWLMRRPYPQPVGADVRSGTRVRAVPAGAPRLTRKLLRTKKSPALASGAKTAFGLRTIGQRLKSRSTM